MLHGDRNYRRKYALLFIAPLLALAAATGPLHAQETESSVRNFEERFFFGKDALYPRMKRRDLGPLLSPLPLSLPQAFSVPEPAPQPDASSAGDASVSTQQPTADEIVEFESFQQILTIATLDPVWPPLPSTDENASSPVNTSLAGADVPSAGEPARIENLAVVPAAMSTQLQTDESRTITARQTSEPRAASNRTGERVRVARTSRTIVGRGNTRVARQSQGGVSAARRITGPQNSAREGLAASGSYEFFVADAHARFEQSVFRSRSN